MTNKRKRNQQENSTESPSDADDESISLSDSSERSPTTTTTPSNSPSSDLDDSVIKNSNIINYKRQRTDVDYVKLNKEIDLDAFYDDEDTQPQDLKSLVSKIVRSANGSDNVYSSWKQSLTKEEITKMEPIFRKILEEFKKKDIDELDIVRSNMSMEEKIESYELLRVIRNQFDSFGETDDWLKMRIKLFDRIKRANPLTDKDQETINILDQINQNNLTIEHKILRGNQPNDVKAKIYQRYCEIKDLRTDDENRGKIVEWINKALQLPTKIVEIDKMYHSSIDLIYKVYDKMNNHLYGQTDAKEKIIDIVSAMWVNPEGSNKSVVLVGPPGVGKTVFARSLADSIGLPFYQISFGGAKDSSILKGHMPTYIGSKPGEIVEGLIKMGAKNGILFLDELDKIDESLPEGKQVADTLLHILDYSQNKDFKDLYIGDIPIDLSNLIIIIAVNDVSKINPVLLNRLQPIQFKSYSLEDKINIGYDYLIPKVLKNLKMDMSEVNISRDMMEYLIRKSHIDEEGVRQLDRNIRTVYERINTLKQIHSKSHMLPINTNAAQKRITLSYDIKGFQTPCTIDKTMINTLFREYTYPEKN